MATLPFISGNDEERARRQLQRNLERTTRYPSPHTSDESVEQPRHNPGPDHLSFLSISHHSRSRDHVVDDEAGGAYSFRDDDDEEGIHPFTGDTMSTTNHHASAVTLNAGLGGRGHRRDVRSVSAAEYDPERRVHSIVVGSGSKMSVLDPDVSRSRQHRSGMSSAPIIVHDTAELDEYAPQHKRAHHAPMPRIRSPNAFHGAPPSRADSPQNQRPKLSDALSHLSFSPKRPRSAQPVVTYTSSSPRYPPRHRHEATEMPTPRPSKSRTPAPSTPDAHADLDSGSKSRFSKLARGIGRDIEQGIWDVNGRVHHRSPVNLHDTAQAQRAAQSQRNPSRGQRQALRGIENLPSAAFVDPIPAPIRTSLPSRDCFLPSSNHVQLPDVTGLTSAVGSPQQATIRYQDYDADEYGENERRLVAILNELQSKLLQLEAENGVSRRRVHELELELERCKKDVVRERTRVLEREEVIVQQQQDAATRINSRNPATSLMDDGRYRLAVEEKKALEELVTTLRSHLARLTSEVASHKDILDGLCNSRDSHAQMLRYKCAEVDVLRSEVERLSGEVDVLRGVVEEGLHQRQANRDNNELTYLSEPEEEDPEQQDPLEEQERSWRQEERQWTRGAVRVKPASWSQSEDEDEGEESLAESPLPSRLSGRKNRANRTDYATAGSSGTHLTTQPHFLDVEELERVNSELEERRTELSATRSRSLSRSHSSSLASSTSSRESEPMPPTPPPEPMPMHTIHIKGSKERPARPAAPTPAHGGRLKQDQDQDIHEEPVPAFPRIRGERLERLFFSDHDVKTCSSCQRRRRRVGEEPRQSPEEDEGFAEGPEAEGLPTDGGRPGATADADDGRLPPQTVLARVVRELEDDFVHYKSIYIELADQYKLMDPASNVAKRNVLADHLREVIDTLEQKGDQIASLYDLLKFGDKPVAESVVPGRASKRETASAPRASDLPSRPRGLGLGTAMRS